MNTSDAAAVTFPRKSHTLHQNNKRSLMLDVRHHSSWGYSVNFAIAI